MPLIRRIVVHKHVAAGIIVGALCLVDLQRVNKDLYLLAMAGGFHRLAVIIGEVVSRG